MLLTFYPPTKSLCSCMAWGYDLLKKLYRQKSEYYIYTETAAAE